MTQRQKALLSCAVAAALLLSGCRKGSSDSGSRGTALDKKRSSRCPASFWVIVNSFMAVLTSPILFCAYFTTRPGSCKESAAAEKERKICEKVFDFHAIIRYNIHRTIMDWRALCCWI